MDVWALGCLMAEISNGLPLFPGESDVDQLVHIIRSLGSVTPRMNELVKRNPLFGGVKLPDYNESDSLDRKLVGLDPLAVDVIKSCLRYEPLQRITTTELLAHPYFAGLEEWYMPEYRVALEKDAAANILGKRAAAVAASTSSAGASSRLAGATPAAALTSDGVRTPSNRGNPANNSNTVDAENSSGHNTTSSVASVTGVFSSGALLPPAAVQSTPSTAHNSSVVEAEQRRSVLAAASALHPAASPVDTAALSTAQGQQNMSPVSLSRAPQAKASAHRESPISASTSPASHSSLLGHSASTSSLAQQMSTGDSGLSVYVMPQQRVPQTFGTAASATSAAAASAAVDEEYAAFQARNESDANSKLEAEFAAFYLENNAGIGGGGGGGGASGAAPSGAAAALGTPSASRSSGVEKWGAHSLSQHWGAPAATPAVAAAPSTGRRTPSMTALPAGAPSAYADSSSGYRGLASSTSSAAVANRGISPRMPALTAAAAAANDTTPQPRSSGARADALSLAAIAGRRGAGSGALAPLDSVYAQPLAAPRSRGPRVTAGGVASTTPAGAPVAAASSGLRSRDHYDYGGGGKDANDSSVADTRARSSPDGKETDETRSSASANPAAWGRRAAASSDVLGGGDSGRAGGASSLRGGSPIHSGSIVDYYRSEDGQQMNAEATISTALREMKAVAAGNGTTRSVSVNPSRARAEGKEGGGNNSSFAPSQQRHDAHWSQQQQQQQSQHSSDLRSVSVDRSRGGFGGPVSSRGVYGIDEAGDEAANAARSHFAAQHAAVGEDSLYDALVSELNKATDHVWRGTGIGPTGGPSAAAVAGAGAGAGAFDAHRAQMQSREGRDKDRALLRSRGATLVGHFDGAPTSHSDAVRMNPSRSGTGAGSLPAQYVAPGGSGMPSHLSLSHHAGMGLAPASGRGAAPHASAAQTSALGGGSRRVMGAGGGAVAPSGGDMRSSVGYASSSASTSQAAGGGIGSRGTAASGSLTINLRGAVGGGGSSIPGGTARAVNQNNATLAAASGSLRVRH